MPGPPSTPSDEGSHRDAELEPPFQALVRQTLEAQSYYRTIVESQQEMVSVARPDGTLVYVNPAYARHFGTDPAALIGVSLYEFVAPHDRDAVRRLLASVVTSEKSVVSENRMTDAVGAERWVTWTNGVSFDANGQATLHSVGRDVTDRKHAESALRASQALLERSGRVAGVGGWELDLASGELSWSAETRRIHEVPDGFVPTLERAIAFYAPQARPVIEAAVQCAMASGQAWDLELPMVTAGGRALWVRAVGEVERVDGLPVRLIGAFQDVSRRRHLEQKVAENERFLRQLTDSLPLRIAYLDEQRRYRFANQELLGHFGRLREEVIGRTRGELLPDEDDAPLRERARAALSGQTLQFEFDESVNGEPNGKTRRIENRLVPDRDESGHVRGFFVTGIDITQRSAAEAALRELTTIFDNTTDFVVQTDWRGHITYLNPSARLALGLSPDETVGHRTFGEFTTPETNARFEQIIIPAVKAQGVWVGETSVKLAGGRTVQVSHMVLAHRDSNGRVERYSGVLRDISAQALAREEIALQTETLRLVAEAIPSTVAVVGADGRYRMVNSAFERWCGRARAEIIGRNAVDVLGEVEYARRLPWIRRVLEGQEVSFQLEQNGADERRFWEITCVPLRLGNGQLDGFVTVSQDITKQKHEEVRLKGLAQRDALTGLLNRAGLEEALEALPPTGTSLAVLYIDLDFFKPVNDTYGHPVGDEVLRQFAKRLEPLVRPTDLVARLGGDEFAIAVPRLPSMLNAQGVAKKVLAAAKSPFEIGQLSVKIDASVGVAFDQLDTVPWRKLLARADEQLLAAKAAGRGRLSAQPR
jgi:diguanylate cyclase (GGDEF)-like protein/PAS domain S-box-containing protein